MREGHLDHLKRLVAAEGWWGLRKIFTRDMPEGFLRNVGWQYGGTVLSSGIGFFYTLLVAAALGAANFGLISLGLGFAALVSQFVNLRVREMVIRYVAKFQEENDAPRVLATVKLALILDGSCGLAALLGILALGPWASAHLLKDPHGALIVALGGLAFVFQNVAADTALGMLRLFSKFRTLAIAEVCGAAFKLSAALAVVWGLGWGAAGVLLVLLATNLMVNLLLLVLALRALHRRVSLRSDAPLGLLRPHRREMTRFLLHNYLSSLSDFSGRDLDINLLGFFTSKEVVGVYKVGKNFAVGLWQLSDAAFLAVYPEIARLWARRQYGALKSFLKRLSLAMAAAAIVLYGAAFFLAPWLIRARMPAEFAQAGTLFRLMGCGIVLGSPLIWAWPLALAAGRTDLTLRSTIEGSLTLVPLNWIAIACFGAAGAALVWAVTQLVFFLYVLLHARAAGLLFPASGAADGKSDGRA